MLQQISVHSQQTASEQPPLNTTAAHSQLAAAFSQLYQKFEESQSTQLALARQFENFQQASIEPIPSIRRISAEPQKSATLVNPYPQSRPRSTPTISLNRIRYTRSCQDGCPCSCHRTRTYFAQPRPSRLLGFGSMSFDGISIPWSSCSVHACKQSTVSSIRMKYFLPTWFVSRIVSIWLTTSPLYGPELLIKVPRYMGKRGYLQSPVHVAILRGDLDTLQCFLAERLCTPNDFIGGDDSLLLVCRPIQFPASWEVLTDEF